MKIAQAMATVLDAKVVQPKDAQVSVVVESDLVGFGSGIFFGNHEDSLLAFVDSLPSFDKKVFIFSTRGRNSFEKAYHKKLRDKLTAKATKSLADIPAAASPIITRSSKSSAVQIKGTPTFKKSRGREFLHLNLRNIKSSRKI